MHLPAACRIPSLLPRLRPFNSPTPGRQAYHSVAASGFNDSELYHSARPSYPPAAIAHIQSLIPASESPTLMELGAGTGLFTAPMLDALSSGNQSFTYVANEPNPKMHESLSPMLSPAVQLNTVPIGGAEKLTGTDFEFDLVIAAQSFHWFTPYGTRSPWASRPSSNSFLLRLPAGTRRPSWSVGAC